MPDRTESLLIALELRNRAARPLRDMPTRSANDATSPRDPQKREDKPQAA